MSRFTRHSTGTRGVGGALVIAAIDDDAAARPVLAAAAQVARLYDAEVRALHVRTDGTAPPVAAARAAGVPLTMLAGNPVAALADATSREQVQAIVIGARATPGGRRPAGSTAVKLITQLDKPVVVVPPATIAAGAIKSVLVPLDGTAESAAALNDVIALASRAAIEVVAAHVLDEGSLPAFNNHPAHEVRVWADEFIARYCSAATDPRLQLRIGEPHEHILDMLQESRCDLVALGWNQNLSPTRAAVVRHLLSHSPVPVLLTPATAQSTTHEPDSASPTRLTLTSSDR
jgi:nucleotide-binding universal stress UspA family protein